MTTKNFTVKNGLSTGNIVLDAATGNATVGNLIGPHANGNSNITIASNANISHYVAGNVTSQLTITGTGANIPGYANVNSLSVMGTSNLGSVGNVIITGGSSGQYLQTNGTGVLIWATVPTSNSIANGTSNVLIPVSGGNVNTSVGGVANVFVVTSTGVNVAGTLNTGTNNANVGNLNATSIVYANNNMVIGSNQTEGGQLVLGYVGVNNITGQANGTWNMDVDGSNNFRLFSQNATGIVSAITMAAYPANNNVVFAGNVSAGYFIGNGSQLTGITVSAGSSIVNGTSNVSIPSSGGNINMSVGGTPNVVTVSSTTLTASIIHATNNGNGTNFQVGDDAWIGDINVADTMSIQGQENAANGYIIFGNADTTSKFGRSGSGPLSYTGAMAVSANITTPQFISNVATGTAPLVVTSTTQVANLNVATAGTAGTVTTNAQPNITSVGTLTTLNSNGLAIIGNGVAQSPPTGANILANAAIAISGNGTNYLTVGQYDTGNNYAMWMQAGFSNAISSPYNIVMQPIGGKVVIGNVANNSSTLTVSGTLSATGNANVGNLGTTGLISATGNVAGGNVTTGGNVVATGNVSGGNVAASTTVYSFGTITAVGNANVGNLTSPGQLISTVSTGTAPFVVTSTTQVANLSVATAGSATTAGTVTTNAQPNITSVGNLTSLTVTGNATVGNLIGPHANGNSNVNIPTANGNINLTAGGNVTFVVTTTGANITGTLNTTGNANTGNIGATFGVFTNVSGNGSTLSSINGANVTGTVANATYATTAGSATNAGTVTTNAQPNITSVGTLTSLTTGLITSSIATANTVTAIFTRGSDNNFQYTLQNGVGTNTTGTEVARAGVNYNTNGWDSFTQYIRGSSSNNGSQVLWAANTPIANISSSGVAVTGVITAGNANVTGQLISTVSTGTAPLVVSSTTLVSNLNANALQGYAPVTANTASTIALRDANGNVSANYFIGNGSQLTGLSPSILANGNSNVNIPAANGNINLTAGGNATLVITPTGANITGTLNTGTGNANVGNLTTPGQMISTVATGTSPLVVSSTTQVNNLNSQYLNGFTWAVPAGVGTTTPNSGSFTTLLTSGLTTHNANVAMGNNYITSPIFSCYKEYVSAVTISTATQTLDLSTTNIFNITLSANTTLSFINPPAAGIAYSFMLYCKQNNVGGNTITWPSSVKFPNGSTPSLTTTQNYIDVLNFFTLDGGVTYVGALSLGNVA